MIWTRRDFERNANDLVVALQTIGGSRRNNSCGSFQSIPNPFIRSIQLKKQNEDNWSLWNWNLSTDTEPFLIHPPIWITTEWAEGKEQSISHGSNRKIEPTITSNESQNHRFFDSANDIASSFLLEDDTIVHDPENIASDVVRTNPSFSSTGEATKTSDTTKWNFSIVYSETWNVPILYFTVESSQDGTPCTRAQVLQRLHRTRGQTMGTATDSASSIDMDMENFLFHNDPLQDDDYYFLSQDEHPVTRVPSFFLHPCQTEARVQLVLNGTTTKQTMPTSTVVHGKKENLAEKTSTDTYKSNPHITVTATATATANATTNPLWIWMSLIFPVLHHGIPSHWFHQVHTFLSERSKDCCYEKKSERQWTK